MKLVYSPSAEQLKKKILQKYSGIGSYFDKLEKNIEESPYNASEEKFVIEGRPVTAQKRKVRTGLSSGNFLISYLYLSLTYVTDEPNQRIVIIGVYVNYYNI